MPAPHVPDDLERLKVDAWVDPVIDAVGHDPRSAYVERFWLATLGPSTVWLLRHLAERLEADGPCTIDLHDTAQALGIARRNGRSSQLVRSIQRSCTFGAARLADVDTLLVRRRLPPLSRRQVERLPDRLQHEHRAWQLTHRDEPEHLQARRRARQLALSLLELGESAEETERMLHRWRFHPALAHDALRWAGERRAASTIDQLVPSSPVARLGGPSAPSSPESELEPEVARS